jgi:3-dehydroquinate synthase
LKRQSKATPLWATARLLLSITVLLVMPLATVAIWGDWGHRLVGDWTTTQGSTLQATAAQESHTRIAAALVVVLAADILLPVPSGPLITLAASQIGWLPTWWWSWWGLSLGGVLAFGLARWGGPRIAHHLAASTDIEVLSRVSSRHAVFILLLTRPLPILAEVAVIVLGLLGCPAAKFVPSLLVGNAVVAGVFAWLGQWAAANDWLAIATGLSIVLPLAATWQVRWWLWHRQKRVASTPPQGDR